MNSHLKRVFLCNFKISSIKVIFFVRCDIFFDSVQQQSDDMHVAILDTLFWDSILASLILVLIGISRA